MRAELTETFDLLLKWQDQHGSATLRFSPVSTCEFGISGEFLQTAGLNYQGPTRVEFATTCYAFALHEFARTLRELADGKSETAEFPGSCLDIHVRRHLKNEWLPDSVTPSEPAFVCELEYETPRWVFGITSFRLQLGELNAPLEAARVIENALKWLEMDLDPLPH